MTMLATAWAWEQEVPPVQKLILLVCADNSVSDERPEATAGPDLQYVAWAVGIPLEEAREIIRVLIADGYLNGTLHTQHPAVVYPRTASAKKQLPRGLRMAVLARDGCCQHCGIDEDLCIDHILAESRGGDDSLGNLQVLCRSCNSRKGIR